MNSNIKSLICGLFDVIPDEKGVLRVVTPMEYIGTKDKVVIRIRPIEGDQYKIDDNGDAMFYASMANADIESEVVTKWMADLPSNFPVTSEDEVIFTITNDQAKIAQLVIKVAQISQEFYAISTSRTRGQRSAEAFKIKVRDAVYAAAATSGAEVSSDVSLDDISGDFVADHMIAGENGNLIVIAATGVQRLLEAELIHTTYERENIPTKVIAAVESQETVGKKQFERAAYFTDTTAVFSPQNFPRLIIKNIH